jgi:hypothetical protein
MGHLLLGFLAAVSMLVNIQLARLGRRQRRRNQLLAPFVASLLLWLPLVTVLIVAGGVALGEISLLGYRDSQDVNGLSWFVVGACLSIFANLCAAMTWIALREALKGPSAPDHLEQMASLAAQDFSNRIEEDEP